MLVVLYAAARGKHATRQQWNADILYELGKQIGKLHRLSSAFEETHAVPSIRDWYDNEEYNFLKYIPEDETIIRDVAQHILTRIQRIPKTKATYGLLHGDLWLENVLVDDQLQLSMVDFQDCEKNYYMFDLAVPIYSAVEYTFAGGGNITQYEQAITAAILDGYEQEHPLPADMRAMLPLFLQLKELFEYSLMHMYWNKNTRSEEQIRIMNHFRMRIERSTHTT